MSFQEFAGFETDVIAGPVWKTSGANSVVDTKTAAVKVTSLCLTAGDEYEIEGAVSSTEPLARAAAVVQDLAPVASQLTPAANRFRAQESIDLLSERRPPRMTRLEPQYVPVLRAVGEQAEDRLGLRRSFTGLPILDDSRPYRRAVRALRAEGWSGAIELPGPTPGISYIVIPRKFACAGALRIGWTGQLVESVPRSLVEYTLGLRDGFPVEDCGTSLNLAGSEVRRATKSWRPPRLLQRIEEAT